MKEVIFLTALIICIMSTVSFKSDPKDLDEQYRDLHDANTS